ncbi:hypothetical protein [Roseovarius sp. CH_XMU1461]|uniref:hypothetical protein n=1 Tax=Roseovarius sp. CH_XMU1461 TaxID=3107777 RepID=UPI00300B5770
MFTYDFDHPEEYVGRFQPILEPVAREILREMYEQSSWDSSDSDHRYLTNRPPSPVTDHVLREIESDFAKCHLRAFHATRLLDQDTIWREGLRALNPNDQIERVRKAFSSLPSNEYTERLLTKLATWNEENDRTGVTTREKLCFVSPHRVGLHDGGCDIFFKLFGGEFIQRVLGRTVKDTDIPINEPGSPAVVVVKIPATSCLHGSNKVLWDTMNSLGHSLPETSGSVGDVCIPWGIPPECIERICDRHDPYLAAVEPVKAP